LLRIDIPLRSKGHRAGCAEAQSSVFAEAGTQAGRRVADSGLDCGGDPATRGTDHTFAEGRGNGRWFTSTGPDGDGEAGTRMTAWKELNWLVELMTENQKRLIDKRERTV
jgi:hypothetical protein